MGTWLSTGHWTLLGMLALVAGSAALAASRPGRDVLFHLLPWSWTGEADRLAASLRVETGQSLADVGAGSGALTLELAQWVGPGGRVFATERTAEQRSAVERRARAEGHAHVVVLEARPDSTNLPDGCCDAIVMRHVLHHVDDRPRFARDVARALRPGGRVAVLDFAPGALWHLGPDHGVGQGDSIAAFSAAGFTVEAQVDEWGGGTYLLVFSRTPAEN